jgi:hypothetical protein
MDTVSNLYSTHHKKSFLKLLILVLVSALLGIYLFFLNPWLSSDLNSDSYSWFLEFSRTIFQPQSAYYAESILLPLIAKLTGLNQSLETYKLLCAVLVLLILPVTAISAHTYFKNIAKSALFILLFALSFSFLQYYILGFPDPLTILLLVTSVFQKRFSVMFLALFLAMLSHFSMAALSVVGLVGLAYFSPNENFHARKKIAGITLAAILAGKAILIAWYFVFHYQLVSRLDWVLGKGYPFFLERYKANISGFWQTPGALLLMLYLIILAYFLSQKKYAFVISAFFALVISYLALFWTVDGLRVFAVVISAPYAYLLIVFISNIWEKWNATKFYLK